MRVRQHLLFRNQGPTVEKPEQTQCCPLDSLLLSSAIAPRLRGRRAWCRRVITHSVTCSVFWDHACAAVVLSDTCRPTYSLCQSAVSWEYNSEHETTQVLGRDPSDYNTNRYSTCIDQLSDAVVNYMDVQSGKGSTVYYMIWNGAIQAVHI